MGVEQRLTVNARAAGPRLGKQVQTVIKGSKAGDWSVADDGTVTSGGIELVPGEYSLDLVAGESAAMEGRAVGRSEEHTSELQSRGHLVCRLLLEKKNKVRNNNMLSIKKHRYRL